MGAVSAAIASAARSAGLSHWQAKDAVWNLIASIFRSGN